MPPFTASLLAAAGRLLAAHTCRDTRASTPGVPAQAGARLPSALTDAVCALDTSGRRQLARAFEDLADDLARGCAPIPRCVAESVALAAMTDAAPRLLALTDDDLIRLGVSVPDGEADLDREFAWWWVLETFQVPDVVGRCFTAENLAAALSGIDVGEEFAARRLTALPPAAWFATFTAMTPRNPDRGFPAHVVAPPPLPLIGEAGFLGPASAGLSACVLLNPVHDPYDGYSVEYRHIPRPPQLAEYLTPLTARLLADAGWELAYAVYWDSVHLKNAPYLYREDDLDSGLRHLPRICDHQDLAWRMNMARCFHDLATDLTRGRAPLPRTNGEEIALKIMINMVPDILDRLDDYGADDDERFLHLGLAPGHIPSARHLRYDAMLEFLYQDWDVLSLFEANEQYVADPGHPAVRLMNMGNLHPMNWFQTFSNMVARDPDRGYDDWVYSYLRRDALSAVAPPAPSPPDVDQMARAARGEAALRAHLARHATDLDDTRPEPVYAFALVRPSAVSAELRDRLRERVTSLIEDTHSGVLHTPLSSRHPTVGRIGSAHLVALPTTDIGPARCDAAACWVLPLQPPFTSPALFTRSSARRAAWPKATSRDGFATALELHDLLVGAELTPAVEALLILSARTLWDDEDRSPYIGASAAVVGADGHEIYGALQPSGALIVEHHDGPPGTLSTGQLRAYMDGRAGPARLYPYCQDLSTAVARRLLGRPGDPEAPEEGDVQTLVHIAALAWVHRIRTTVEQHGPISRQQAVFLQPPLLRTLQSLPDAGDDVTDDDLPPAQELWKPVWEMLATGEELAPGMGPADAAWRDPGVLAQRVFTGWQGDAEGIYQRFGGGCRWFTSPADATIIDRTFSALGIY
ncbi:hypothetical protein [Streptosporangium sp. CA-115845]|uniref:hypothetical protein n=1 Tax=Streptosporangium sp. CA-115845 TaxID=3240071 RepID=UPI003D8EE829